MAFIANCYMYIDLFALQHIADRPCEYITYYHGITNNTVYVTNDKLILSQSRDLNPGPPGMKRPLCHLSYHPLTLK